MASWKDLISAPETPAEVAKALVYIALGAAGALAPALADNVVTPEEIVQAAIIVIGLIPVYLLAGNGAKTAAAFATAGLQVVLGLLAQYTGFADIPASAWLTVVISAFAAIGVAVTPNKAAHKADPVEVVNEVKVETPEQTEPVIAVLATTTDSIRVADHQDEAPEGYNRPETLY